MNINSGTINYHSRRNRFLCIAVSIVVMLGFSFTIPIVANADAASDAANLAASINSGPAGSIVKAAASGSIVSVTTKTSGNTSAPSLDIDIPAGVVVEWGAEYINKNLDDDLISIDGDDTGVFRIVEGADIELTYSTGNGNGAVVSKDPAVEMTGGYVFASGEDVYGLYSDTKVTLSHGVVDVNGLRAIGIEAEEAITIARQAGVFIEGNNAKAYNKGSDATETSIASNYANRRNEPPRGKPRGICVAPASIEKR